MALAEQLPTLKEQPQLPIFVQEYLQQLALTGFSGDIETSFSSRLAVATDNSVYQIIPQAILLPKTTLDVSLIGEIAKQEQFSDVTFSPRGGGTGTNGQSLTLGVVVDLSRHMKHIIEINLEEQWVKVEAGVVKDQLNDVLRPHGYFFSPDLSTSNRATLGGMINTDASGQGSLYYGKTSDHVLGLKAVLIDGSIIDTQPLTELQIREQSSEQTRASSAMKVSSDVCRDNRAEIVAKFPPLNRFLTGYDLQHPYDEAMTHFDIGRILCGSEGSLAFITEAKLNITPIPTVRKLINIKYDSFDSALRNAPMMVEADALSVETVDSRVLNLAKQDIVWHSVKELITDVPGADLQGLNIVEFAGNSESDIQQKVTKLTDKLELMLENQQAGIIGYQCCDDLASINKIYGMRKKSVGLLGATKGRKKPIAFTEDTCVPPENLADFIAEFRELLDSHNLAYGMFGHVDAGVLHVRPALDLCDPHQEQLLHQISDQVVQLVSKYKGLMWGEHGKGFRSEYGPEFFGDSLFSQLRRIKTAFDPHNQMNPGKVCTPLDRNDKLASVNAVKRGFYDRQIPVTVRDSFKQVMECNGNGLCFNYDKNSPMCPSMKVSGDRRQSPKGRATMMREWLRQLSEQGVDINALEQSVSQGRPSIKQIINKFKANKKRDQFDFSHQVLEVMNSCLACKACASQCPISVDVPSFRSRFFNLYYSKYPRPFKDYLVANVESYLPLMAKAAKWSNKVTQNKLVSYVTENSIGYVDTPELSIPTLTQQISDNNGIIDFDLAKLRELSSSERENYLLVVQDPFTSYYDAGVVADFMTLAVKLGKKPVLLPFKPNGKAQHVKGFLAQFKTTAQTTAQFLNQVANLGIPMVGVDPALVLCYRDEYQEILGVLRGEFAVLTVHEWLQPRLPNIPNLVDSTMSSATTGNNTEKNNGNETENKPWYLFAHCTEKTKLPNAEQEWGAIFTHFGLTLQTVPVGCCGMAGTFGHEKENRKTSQDIYNLSWKPQMDLLDKTRCMSTGYSCRSQVKRFEGVNFQHPLQVLLSNI
ncbi:FAD-binding oxidoreductase [Vibrio sp. SS-MA-C1-2]|uniref:D-2-hydroxyglutarate dehydrogenase YdiJ n=1 Tax=Vibrio sp. SS-MA-C1-2 TaxID=2908646 RepID=UPI001F264F1B|nr:FAD-binding and (Fe-S)-binding domain-containing protein [Vibrio sp. SS-MA-C1-2]UJF17683.1 FAD-binding oxidoreductase [Vibrio sp. SS-MA-C1-2]